MNYVTAQLQYHSCVFMTEYRDSVLKKCEHMSNHWSEALQDLCLKGYETHKQNQKRKHDERVDVGMPTEGDQPSTLFQTSAG